MHLENFINFPDILDILNLLGCVIKCFIEIFKVNKVNYFQNTNIQKMHGTIRVPALEFNFNLVVCPLQGTLHDVSSFKLIFWKLTLY